MEMEQLVDNNPWWRDQKAIGDDQKIRDFDGSKIPWTPRLKKVFDLDSDKIYIMRGPRQVGKTTLMKLIIRDMLEKDPSSSRNIFYFTCDVLSGNQELVDMIQQYLDFSSGSPNQRRFLFIDEICQVKEWEKGIKYLVDTGALTNTTALLTGSHSMDLKYSTERLPGRRGEGKDTLNKIMMPMKFKEYVETVNPSLKKKLRGFYFLKREKRLEKMFNLFQGEIDKTMIDDYHLHKKELNRLFDSYLLTGGIMRAINQYYTDQHIENSTYEIYVRSLIGDLRSWDHRESISKQVLRSVATRMTTTASLNSIAEENEIKHHNTISSYLQALEDAMVINVFQKLDMNKKRPMAKSAKKIYFTDPFIHHAIKNWTQGKTDYYHRSEEMLFNTELKSKLVEMVVGDHLIRLAYNLNPSDVFSHHERIYYWKKKGTDKEIDFVLNQDDSFYPIEVKYQNTINKTDFAPLYTFKKGIILSKQDVETHNQYSVLPVEAFLLLI